jgi:hypothetical protein
MNLAKGIKMAGWISVEKGLPPNGDSKYLVCFEREGKLRSSWAYWKNRSSKDHEWKWITRGCITPQSIRYWMPIPLPPLDDRYSDLAVLSLEEEKSDDLKKRQSDPFKNWRVVSSSIGKYHNGMPCGEILCRTKREVDEACYRVYDPRIRKYIE